ncbi:MAG: LysM peptidoglycan-binding domain-containing protein [Lachnospiraceae bacterium]|nr:LysM peptidoglycan-binding domain-containing protein [Lachnospiraceae bacterium]
MKQKRRLTRTLLILGIVFFIAIIAVIPSVYSAAPEAERTADARTQVCYRNYEVRQNDSLWKIAGEHAASYGVSTGAYVDLLRKMNHLSGDRIISGQKLIIPYKTE